MPPPFSSIIWTEKENVAQIVILYHKYFDRWTHSDDERTEYNKYFITLLFAQTLVAVLTGLAAGKISGDVVTFTKALLIIVFVAGAVISFIWGLKLQILNDRDNAQITVLKEMEIVLPVQLRAVSKEVKTALKKVTLKDLWETRSWQYTAHWLNYYGIAWLLLVLYVVLSILAIFWTLGIGLVWFIFALFVVLYIPAFYWALGIGLVWFLIVLLCYTVVLCTLAVFWALKTGRPKSAIKT